MLGHILSHNRTIMDANANFVCILDVICSMSKKDKVVQKSGFAKMRWASKQVATSMIERAEVVCARP